MGETLQQNQSNSKVVGVDLLKIIAMLLIVMLHVLGHGGVLDNASSQGSMWWVMSILEGICIIGVNCYGLITGYLHVGKKVKLKNIINLWLQVFFYSVLISLLFMLWGGVDSVANFNFLEYFFPVLTKKYWYFSAYFVLYLCMPLLNVILEKSNKRFLSVFLVCALIVACLSNLTDLGLIITFKHGYSFLWLAVLYLAGGYIKKYDIASKLKPRLWLLLYLGSVVISFIFGVINSAMVDFADVAVVYDYTFVFNFLSSCFLLLWCVNLKFKSNKLFDIFAKVSFGVYIIHEHIVFKYLFVTNKFIFLTTYNPFVALLCIIAIAVGVYVACGLIEYCRQLFFKICRVDKLSQFIDNKVTNL